MPNASFANEPTMATASQITRTAHRANRTEEAAFLRQQAADAQVAMRRTLAALPATAYAAVDVRAWTRQHPWAAVGLAAAAGFLAATTVLAPPRQGGSHEPPATARASWASAVLGALWGMGRGMLTSALVGALSGALGAAAADDDESASAPTSVAR